MLNLPYVPQPYPDEILGSWLARTALLNGRGAWRSLLEEYGFGRRIDKPIFDMPDYEPKVERLLNHLGCSFEDALRELSTYHFWAAFERSGTQYLKGTNNVKALGYKDGVITQLSRVGKKHMQSLSLKPYFCSLCLVSDFSNHGEPFWHRSHQLPTVYYCPTHHVPLLNKCPSCLVSNVTGGKNLMPLPTLVCSCGFDYRLQDNHQILSSGIYKRLTNVSVAALNNMDETWSMDNVKAYFNYIIFEKLGSKKGLLFSKLKSVFKAQYTSVTRFSITPPGSDISDYFARCPSLFRASEYCLVMAALDIDFVSASSKFARFHELKSKNDNRKQSTRVPENVDIAFAQLSERIQKETCKPLSKHKMLYWYLRFHAVDRLRLLSPNIKLDGTPSIEEDRSKILKSLQESKKKKNNSASEVRAFLRDSDWFEKQKKIISQTAQDHAKTIQLKQNDLLIGKLESILYDILKKEKRPERITLIRLGAHIAYSSCQMVRLMKIYPEFNKKVQAINRDKFRRQLVWAASELKKEGVILTSKGIQRKAGLPFSPVTNNIVKQLVLGTYFMKPSFDQ